MERFWYNDTVINCLLTVSVHNYYAQPIYYTYVTKCHESLTDWSIPLMKHLCKQLITVDSIRRFGRRSTLDVSSPDSVTAERRSRPIDIYFSGHRFWCIVRSVCALWRLADHLEEHEHRWYRFIEIKLVKGNNNKALYQFLLLHIYEV